MEKNYDDQPVADGEDNAKQAENLQQQPGVGKLRKS